MFLVGPKCLVMVVPEFDDDPWSMRGKNSILSRERGFGYPRIPFCRSISSTVRASLKGGSGRQGRVDIYFISGQ
jgi:hypothetical protein